ncbi:MAG: SAM-dependent methyltransferase [Bacteroidota bacterium]
MSNKKGSVFLIPSTLGDSTPEKVIPSYNLELLRNLDVFIVEEVRTARRFLRKCGFIKDFESTTFHILNEHTTENEISTFLDQAKSGSDTGLLSEAGCPAVADPGSTIVKLAHEYGIRVVPLSGPSSIIMALMASGFNGQNFSFHGYLPVKAPERNQKIRELDRDMIRSGQTHIFIEAPYRNNHMIESILSNCSNDTMLCIASNISLSDESIKTATVAQWKKLNYEPGKKPTVFLLSR